MKRITKHEARKLYDAGKTVYIIPCKILPNENSPMFGKGFEVNRCTSSNDWFESTGNSFEHRVDAMEYYNCNNTTGLYASFYVEKHMNSDQNHELWIVSTNDEDDKPNVYEYGHKEPAVDHFRVLDHAQLLEPCEDGFGWYLMAIK